MEASPQLSYSSGRESTFQHIVPGMQFQLREIQLKFARRQTQ